jgi:hypothetical protein
MQLAVQAKACTPPAEAGGLIQKSRRRLDPKKQKRLDPEKQKRLGTKNHM